MRKNLWWEGSFLAALPKHLLQHKLAHQLFKCLLEEFGWASFITWIYHKLIGISSVLRKFVAILDHSITRKGSSQFNVINAWPYQLTNSTFLPSPLRALADLFTIFRFLEDALCFERHNEQWTRGVLCISGDETLISWTDICLSFKYMTFVGACNRTGLVTIQATNMLTQPCKGEKILELCLWASLSTSISYSSQKTGL